MPGRRLANHREFCALKHTPDTAAPDGVIVDEHYGAICVSLAFHIL
jgi:hypothetical protein